MIDPQRLLDETLPNFVAGLCVAAICLAAGASRKAVARAIIRWRTSKLPKGPDSERATEELLAIAAELSEPERIGLNCHLTLRPGELEREILIRTVERQSCRHAGPASDESGISSAIQIGAKGRWEWRSKQSGDRVEFLLGDSIHAIRVVFHPTATRVSSSYWETNYSWSEVPEPALQRLAEFVAAQQSAGADIQDAACRLEKYAHDNGIKATILGLWSRLL